MGAEMGRTRYLALWLIAGSMALAACSGPDQRDESRTPTATQPTAPATATAPLHATATTSAPTLTASTTATRPQSTATQSVDPTATASATTEPPATATTAPDPLPPDQQLGLPDMDAHYRLDIHDLDVDSGYVAASEALTISAFNGSVPAEIFLQVVPAWDGFFSLDSAWVNGFETSPEVLNDGFTLAFRFPQGAPVPLEIALDFHLNVGTDASGWGGTARDGDALRLGYWFPIVSTDHGYSATLDPSYTAVAAFDVSVTLAPDIVFAHTGEITGQEQLDDGRVRYALAADRVRDFTLILSREYEVDTAVSATGVALELYSLPASEAGLSDADAQLRRQNILGWAADAVDQLAALVGPYPYTTLRFADAGPSMPGGVEFPNLIYINPNYAPLDRLIYHETAHQWFYGIIGNRTLHDGWIDEGGAEFFERGLPTGFTEVPPIPSGDYLYALDAGWLELVPDANRSFYFSIYEQGARFYYAVLDSMGWDAFWSAMQDIYATFTFEIVTAWDMLTTFQKHSPVDLRPLFDETFRYEWVGEVT
jgi:hypothetical protein